MVPEMCFQINGKVIFHGEETGREKLLQQKQELKRWLLRQSIEKDEVVALLMNRTPKLFTLMFACLELGIPFLPIDIKVPVERMQSMLTAAKVNRVLSDIVTENEFCGRKVLALEAEPQSQNMDDEEQFSNKSDIAYLLFTSGTTGMPKAVEVRRTSLQNFIEAIPEVVLFPQNARIACFTNQTFDIFFLESIMALHLGMTVVLADEAERSNPRRMKEMIQQYRMNAIQMTPSALMMLQMVDESLSCLREVEVFMVGGEAFPNGLLKRLQQIGKGRIYNMYGPTETTIWSSVADLTDSNEINIGKAIKNTEIFVVDENLKSVPEGVEGEIIIAGDGLAKGYCNDREKTDCMFVYYEHNGRKIRAYRTGDLGYYDSRGILYCCGRKDNQVKILGHRIELGDVEENIKRIKGIQNAMVAASGEEIKRLLCFYIADKDMDESELSGSARMYLPEYMVPTKWIRVAEFIYTSSNKADRRAMLCRYAEEEQNNASAGESEEEEEKRISEYFQRKGKKFAMDKKIAELLPDSLEYINFIVFAEEQFDVEFEDSMLNQGFFEDFRDLYAFIKENGTL